MCADMPSTPKSMESTTALVASGSEEATPAPAVETDPSEGGAKSLRRSVSFGDIVIREYSRCLGNNPATTHGPPLSLGWSYTNAGSYKLEDYEENRPPRRESSQMLIPGVLREEIILSQTDATRNQIRVVESEIKAIRHHRQMCVAMQEFEEFAIVFESLGRKLKRVKTGISKKKEKEMLWENARRYTRTEECHATPKLYQGDEESTADLSSYPVLADQ